MTFAPASFRLRTALPQLRLGRHDAAVLRDQKSQFCPKPSQRWSLCFASLGGIVTAMGHHARGVEVTVVNCGKTS